MKRIKHILLILFCCMFLLQPVTALGDSDNDLHVLSFDMIEEEVQERNPVIANNQDEAVDGIAQIDDSIDALIQQEKMFDEMSASLIADFTTIKVSSMPKDSLLNMINSYPESLPVDTNGLSDPVTILTSSTDPLLGFVTGQDTNGADMWFLLTMTAPQDLSLDYINFDSLKNYQLQIQSIENQIANMETQQDDSETLILQVEIGNSQIVWGVQQMFLTYIDLQQQLAGMQLNRKIQQKQVTLNNLKLDLGFITAQQCRTDESKLTDLDLTIASLEDNMASLLGNLNVSLGQDFDTPLTLKAAPEPDLEGIGSMDYDTDLDKALTNSILVRMEDSYTMQEQQRRETALDFDTRYKDVQEKVKTWNKEKDKLLSEQASYAISQKSFELGFISPLSLDIASQSVQKQLENKEKAKTDLLEAYTGYQWLLGGVKL
ncbi:TolC family protein [Dehalobacter sp. DCM]|uniref:TolC family protein n=1 Tax=Dehalobacter sp. DCM TaxID=2907827 RepID=UPI0030821B35|nr:TolC family protein [Dehalobacter sp. DCM]